MVLLHRPTVSNGLNKCLKRRGRTNLIQINAFQNSVHINCYFSIALFQTQSTNIADAQCSKILHNNLRVLILIISPVIEFFFWEKNKTIMKINVTMIKTRIFLRTDTKLKETITICTTCLNYGREP